MYDAKMALAVKSTGKVLREAKDGENTIVFLPFGCEYSVLVKNLNSVRALVRIWIDGTDVTDGTELVVNANSSIDLERFIKNGNMSAGNRFKFIERTAGVSAHRGNKIDDGLIRVEFEFERRPVPTPHWHRSILCSSGVPVTITDYSLNPVKDHSYYNSSPTFVGNATASLDMDGVGGSAAAYTAQIDPEFRPRSRSRSLHPSSGAISKGVPTTDVGVTVAGSISSQQFVTAAWFPTDGVKHVMVMQMLGEIEGQNVVKPLTVNHKPTCTSCGKVNKATAKFCSECGTGLQLVETMA